STRVTRGLPAVRARLPGCGGDAMTTPAEVYPQDRPRSTRVVVFKESLHGLVRPADLGSALADRVECAIAAETAMVSAGDVDVLFGCALEDLRIAVDVGTQTPDGALAGVVRSGVVHVEGRPALSVQDGDFELFPRVAGDARRMRYRLW